MTFAEMHKLLAGRPLPDELKTADWGDPIENGLRAAWPLEPVAKEYAIGTVLKTRILFHNTGKQAVVFSTDAWHQWDLHKAHDAKGVELRIEPVFSTGLTPMVTYRLAPGEYCEVGGRNLIVGGDAAGAIPAKAGDEITLSHVVDATTAWTRSVNTNDWEETWNKSIAARVEREGPLPQAAADREQLIRRVTFDIFGIPARSDEITAFVGDDAPNALAKLTMRLQGKPRIQPWSGSLPTGETKFRVIAADAKAVAD